MQPGNGGGGGGGGGQGKGKVYPPPPPLNHASTIDRNLLVWSMWEPQRPPRAYSDNVLVGGQYVRDMWGMR